MICRRMILALLGLGLLFSSCGREFYDDSDPESDSQTSPARSLPSRGNVMKISFSDSPNFIVIDGAAILNSDRCSLYDPTVRDSSTKETWNPLQVFWVIRDSVDLVDYGKKIKGIYFDADEVELDRFKDENGELPLGFKNVEQKKIDAMKLEKFSRADDGSELLVKFGGQIDTTIKAEAVISDDAAKSCYFKTSYCSGSSGVLCNSKNKAAFKAFTELRIKMFLNFPVGFEFI